MHAVVKESLEAYLAGALEPVEHRAVAAHLGVCESCRRECQELQELSLLFGSLRSEKTPEPSLGFYCAVMQRVAERRSTPSFASLFALDLLFARRLVFASVMTLAVLGGYMVTREAGSPQGPLPVSLIAEQVAPSYDSAPAPEAMLATLTAYVR